MNLQEQISRIQSMMGVLNEEQESFITKFKKIKEFKDEGFKNVFSEKISGGIPDKTGEFYYVFPQTNSGCKELINNSSIGYIEKNTVHWSGVKKIEEGDAVLLLSPRLNKKYKETEFFDLELRWACSLVYGDAAVKKIKTLINSYNSKKEGVSITDIKELKTFMLNKDEIERINTQSELDLALAYVPPKPKSLEVKDENGNVSYPLSFSATSDGNISVSVLENFPSDKDPNRLFYFDGPIVTYRAVVYDIINIDLFITDYDNTTNTLTMDLRNCPGWAGSACKDDKGNPKVITTKLEKIRPIILKGVDDGYKVNDFKEIKFDITTKNKKGEPEKKTAGLIPINKTVNANWVFFGTKNQDTENITNLQEQIKRILMEELYSPSGTEMIPNKLVTHRSSPAWRKSIKLNGLETSVGECYQSYVGGEVECRPSIFATDSLNEDDMFDNGYDDDIWLINTECAGVTWYRDAHFEGGDYEHHIVTFEDIPSKCIKLIHKGTGKSIW